MKKTKILLILSTLGLLTACSGALNPDSGSVTPIEPEEILNNFFNKIDEHNYTIDNADYLHVYEYSDEFLSVNVLGSVSYYMNTNPLELYYLHIDEFETELDVDDIQFRGKTKAVESDTAQAYLINYWRDMAGENIWDSFTNHPTDPLRFTIVKESQIYTQMVGYIGAVPGEYKTAIDCVDLVLDKEVPTSARIEINFIDEAEAEPIITNIKFNIERKATIVDSWLNDPNRKYPETKTKWDDADKFAFNSVFRGVHSDKLDEIIPFPSEFATRTFYRYANATFVDMNFYGTDTLATKENVDKYAENLVKNYGYEKHSERIDGVYVDRYDKFLYDYQDIYHSYASIYIEYVEGEGVSFLAKQNYNEIKYEGRGSLNYFLKDMNFPELGQNDYLTTYEFFDETLIQNDGYIFMTTYKKAYEVQISYTNYTQAVAYVNDYYDLLESQGFRANEFRSFASKQDGESSSSRITTAIDGEYVHMLFWYIEYYTDEYATSWMDDYGFPAIDMSLNTLTKDARLYYIYDANVYQEDAIAIDVELASNEEREAYIEDYVTQLLANGFEEYDHLLLKVPRRNTAFYNAEKRIIVAFNDVNGNNIPFHLIKVADDFEPLH